MNTHTDTQTDRQTDISTYGKHRPMLWKLKRLTKKGQHALADYFYFLQNNMLWNIFFFFFILKQIDLLIYFCSCLECLLLLQYAINAITSVLSWAGPVPFVSKFLYISFSGRGSHAGASLDRMRCGGWTRYRRSSRSSGRSRASPSRGGASCRGWVRGREGRRRGGGWRRPGALEGRSGQS